MCKVSDKIRFCSCNVDSVDQFKHYWVYHSFDKSKNEIVIGDPVLPLSIDVEQDLRNHKFLLERVNDPDAFDVSLNPKNKDRLQLSFQFGDSYESMVHYGYRYKGGKWIEEEFDGLEWMWHHNETNFGEIDPGIEY